MLISSVPGRPRSSERRVPSGLPAPGRASVHPRRRRLYRTSERQASPAALPEGTDVRRTHIGDRRGRARNAFPPGERTPLQYDIPERISDHPLQPQTTVADHAVRRDEDDDRNVRRARAAPRAPAENQPGAQLGLRLCQDPAPPMTADRSSARSIFEPLPATRSCRRPGTVTTRPSRPDRREPPHQALN